MKNNIASWIDQPLIHIENSELFAFYFQRSLLENIDDIYFLKNEDKGIDLILNSNKIATSIHLFSKDFQNFNQFVGDIPYSLEFENSIEKVHQKLGKPDSYGGGFDHEIFGYVEKWEKYFFNDFSIHIRYSKGQGGILLITIGSLTFEKINSFD